jgi:hypothetical protein
MHSNRQWFWLAILLAILTVVVGILINVGTADNPWKLFQVLWSPERRWIWLATIIASFVLIWTQQFSVKNSTSLLEREAKCRESLPYKVGNQIKLSFKQEFYKETQLGCIPLL